MSKRHADATSEASTLAAYLRQIAKTPLLTADEERWLGVRIKRDRDEAAVSQLVESHLRFVVSYAKRYRGCGTSILDLIHEGNLGLIEAARRFDPSRNVKFISCAVWWVRQSMMHAMSDETRAFSFPPKLVATFGCEAAGLSLGDPIGSIERGGRQPELGDSLGHDQVGVDDELMYQSDLHELVDALRDADGNEQEVVRLRFGLEDDEPRALQASGDRLHLSRERIRQIESRAKDKLRHSARLRSHLN